jgi:hypothetical protein
MSHDADFGSAKAQVHIISPKRKQLFTQILNYPIFLLVEEGNDNPKYIIFLCQSPFPKGILQLLVLK